MMTFQELYDKAKVGDVLRSASLPMPFYNSQDTIVFKGANKIGKLMILTDGPSIFTDEMHQYVARIELNPTTPFKELEIPNTM